MKKTTRSNCFANAVADPNIRAALQALNDNDEHLARVTKLNLMEVFQRLDTLEAIVFAPTCPDRRATGDSGPEFLAF